MVEVAWEGQNTLGEGAFWNYKTQKLWWVDIEEGNLHILDPETEDHQSYHVGARVGTVVPDREGNAVVALETGVFILDLDTEEMTPLSHPEDSLDNMRYNDGKVCPGGSLWVGSMHLKQTSGEASLYRIDPDGKATRVISNVTISNGITWSLDSRTMYYIDTPTGKVQAFDFDLEEGTISRGRAIIEVPDSLGYPDGMTIDEGGNLWIALWNGNAVSQWDPQTGELLQRVEVPAHNITSCAFGGRELDTLFITSSRQDMTPEEREAYPLAGSVFKVVPGVKGVELPFFGNPK